MQSPQPSQTGWTIWFTGLPGAGKSTLAKALAALLDRMCMPYELLDGDDMRRQLCRDLGFSKQDRDENIRRLSYLARLLNRHGVTALVAAISPYREARLNARAQCSSFVEVYVDCPLPTLVKRDRKGLYQRALTGDLPFFSGISDPYEPPLSPEIYINSGLQSEEESVATLIGRLAELGFLLNR